MVSSEVSGAAIFSFVTLSATKPAPAAAAPCRASPSTSASIEGLGRVERDHDDLVRLQLERERARHPVDHGRSGHLLLDVDADGLLGLHGRLLHRRRANVVLDRMQRLDLRRGVRRALASAHEEQSSADGDERDERAQGHDANPLTHVVSIGIARARLDGKRRGRGPAAPSPNG